MKRTVDTHERDSIGQCRESTQVRSKDGTVLRVTCELPLGHLSTHRGKAQEGVDVQWHQVPGPDLKAAKTFETSCGFALHVSADGRVFYITDEFGDECALSREQSAELARWILEAQCE